MEKALQHKEEGNKSFSSKDFSSAIASYRRGLASLDAAFSDNTDNNSSSSNDDEERNKCEVALRSNLALCLLRLAESNGHNNNSKNSHHNNSKLSNEEIRNCLTEARGECTAAIQFEGENAKLWYRRGQSQLLLAATNTNNTTDHGDSDTLQSCEALLSAAESDIRHCEELLQLQLREDGDTNKATTAMTSAMKKGVIQQIMEARKALKRIESDRVKLGASAAMDPNSTNSSSTSSKSISSKLPPENEVQPKSPKRNGLIATFSRSRSGRNAANNNATATNHHGTSDGVGSHNPPPSPSEQREQFLQLLSRVHHEEAIDADADDQPPQKSQNGSNSSYPPQIGEAYFLINMPWWESWCRYVNFFHSYKLLTDENNLSEEKNEWELKRHVCRVDVMNGKLLQCLPEGASLPPGWEREKKEVLMIKKNKRKGESSDSSSSSESSVESGSQDILIPGAIDNTSLMLERNNSWLVPPLDVSINNHGSNSNSSDNGESEENVPLKSNLVRGHHFEILPREAYAALISWYGEVSTPILRRVQSIDELPWIASNDKQNRNGLSVRLALYGDRWDVTAVNSSNRDYNGNFFCCCACRAPYAKSKCTKCKCARYCSKDCQKSHWPYHKNHCWSLMKQKFQNEALAAKNALVPEMNVWGRVGLNNLGNTCFMSAAVQCMSHVTPLTRLFLSNQFLTCLNENNINGTGGKVANAYATLMKDLWMGGHQHSSLSPTILKRAIELFAPQFYGVQQQDSAEFLSYLLDALHEDLNMIRNPPYVEMPDVDRGRKLTVCGAETWDAMLRRNSSYIFENFYGMYKSTCVCPKCETISVTFDTFNHITLEIPRVSKLDFVIVLMRDPGDEEPLPVRYCVSVPQTGTVSDLISALGSMSGIPASRLSICNVVIEKCLINQLYREDASVSSLTNEDLLVAYETAPLADTSKVNAVVIHRTDSGVFGLPILTSIDRDIKCCELYEKLWKYVKPFVMINHKDIDEDPSSFQIKVKSCLRVRVTDASGRNDRKLRTGGSTSILSATSNDKVADLMSLKEKEKFAFFAMEYSDLVANTDHFDKSAQIYAGNFLMIMNHNSTAEYKNRVNRMHEGSSVTLDQCFESFTQPERLDDDNMWYCPQCKEHVKAMKTVVLWKIPNMLIIHLKRFEYRNSFDRNKIGTLVEFPIDGFDMKRHCAYDPSAGSGSNYRTELVDEETPNIYDLFGVTNHYGRLGYGHYTAYARRFNEFGMESNWCEFDDENVSEVDAHGIVSPSAYVLFYRRRVLL